MSLSGLSSDAIRLFRKENHRYWYRNRHWSKSPEIHWYHHIVHDIPLIIGRTIADDMVFIGSCVQPWLSETGDVAYPASRILLTVC